MGFQQYPYGSEWRRWELHLHTPLTQKEDNYEGNTDEEKWDNFYQSINDYIGDGTDPLKAICAIAVTDYLSIDNYLKVRDDKRLPSCVELLLPNVELRMTPVAKKSPVNIHCIFSPEIADTLEDTFFSKLKFSYADISYSATRGQLTSLGRAFSSNNMLDDDSAHKVGLEQYVISLTDLESIIQNDAILRKNTLIVVSNGSNDGASGITNNCDYFINSNVSQLDATRRKLYQLADMIFSSSKNDIDYFTGKGGDNEQAVITKCGSLKPCIHGSDAHTNAKIFEPDQKRYCWIKADPTFEGLKQILYEPNDRVCISPLLPEQKQDYLVIDRVEIINNDHFSKEPIYLNDKLNCIIGGKSTGKSLLLHNMALAIDKNQVKHKEVTVKTNVKDIEGELKVYWRDDRKGVKAEEQRKIVYIPQTYLNRLSDEKEETTEIDKIIEDIVLQKEEASALFQEMDKKISERKQLITRTILEFIEVDSAIKSIISQQKEIGSSAGITAEIIKLTDQLNQLSKEYSVTEDEVKKYQEASEKIQQLNGELALLSKEKVVFESIEAILIKKDFSSLNISKFNDHFVHSIETIQQVANDQWLSERGKIIVLIEEKINELTRSLSEYKDQVENLKPKMEGSEQLNKISSAILREKSKLEQIKQLEHKCKEFQVTYDDKMALLSRSFETYKGFYNEYVQGINEIFKEPIDDLEFKVTCVLRANQLSQKLLEIIDRRMVSRFEAFSISSIEEANLTIENISCLISAITVESSEKLKLKDNYDAEGALREIFNDWYNIDYVVVMDGDSIEDMSPGKKALVLLKLLISLAESNCPILIDQPEDDLDNRSIFDELIQFVKKKKIARQIIVATHNANIVLGGDAELVIVANQQGKNAPNKKYRFEYRGGSIENDAPIKSSSGAVEDGILSKQGIQSHICEILEGGERAFDLRRNKYRFIK